MTKDELREKKEAVKTAIVAAVPDIMELKFGCRIFIPGADNHSNKGKRGFGTMLETFVGRKISWSGYDATDDRISALMDSGAIRPMFGIAKNNVEILGRPITLEDVLRAIGTIHGPYVVVSDNGRFHKRVAPMKHEELGDWVLGQPLDSQPDETIDFLYDLICEK